MKKLILVGAAVLSLAACGSDPSTINTGDGEDHGNGFYVYHVHDVDGHTITCLWQNDNGAISCDWNHPQ